MTTSYNEPLWWVEEVKTNGVTTGFEVRGYFTWKTPILCNDLEYAKKVCDNLNKPPPIITKTRVYP